MISIYSYNRELAYLDSIITIVIISIAVEGEINHLFGCGRNFLRNGKPSSSERLTV